MTDAPPIRYQWLPAGDVSRLAEIDRSERVTLIRGASRGRLTNVESRCIFLVDTKREE